jgi:hypothetical protein
MPAIMKTISPLPCTFHKISCQDQFPLHGGNHNIDKYPQNGHINEGNVTRQVGLKIQWLDSLEEFLQRLGTQSHFLACRETRFNSLRSLEMVVHLAWL